MDTSAPGIQFDDNGQCNFCRAFEAVLANDSLIVDPLVRESRLAGLVAAVKKNGAGKRYDCIVGVSGGVDSSWALVQAVRLGLRPLAVHMDNGWNTELAANNIANLIETLDVDLYTYVIDWAEYRELMQAFFDADVIDVELLYDNAMLAVCYQQADAYRLKYILSGYNLSTEGLRMPLEWSWRDKLDATNIRSIAKAYGVRIKSFPLFSNARFLRHRHITGTRWVPFLDYLDYRKDEALDTLVAEYGYKPYPYKHYESVFTRFYQGHILPEKFGVDKRRAHLSSLIITGQLSRADALAAVERIPYPTDDDLEKDKAYVVKKMNWQPGDLEAYLARPERGHDEWATDPVKRYVWPVLARAGAWRDRVRASRRAQRAARSSNG
ncbi:MAG: N-acetyl sugar amidotransferase [Microbacterium sp.]|nr:N-acetyl sugar amidotransferase [Microbacterium sp.]MBA4346872.1 N-acetyl sugar amidotransferase [Microbacterium sp.]